MQNLVVTKIKEILDLVQMEVKMKIMVNKMNINLLIIDKYNLQKMSFKSNNH